MKNAKYKVGIITLSDKGSQGLREDKSGPAIRQMLEADGRNPDGVDSDIGDSSESRYQVVEELLLPVDGLFQVYPRCTVSALQEKKIRCGNQVKTSLSGGDYRVYAESGEFLMLGRVEDGIMKTVKSFFEV